MKKEITVYACRFTTRISTDIKDLIETAIDAGDIKDFEDWIDAEFEPSGLADLLNDYKTTEEVKNELQLHYDIYCLDRAKCLVQNGDDYWSDTITIEI